jgi:hypothetical protein
VNSLKEESLYTKRAVSGTTDAIPLKLPRNVRLTRFMAFDRTTPFVHVRLSLVPASWSSGSDDIKRVWSGTQLGFTPLIKALNVEVPDKYNMAVLELGNEANGDIVDFEIYFTRGEVQ